MPYPKPSNTPSDMAAKIREYLEVGKQWNAAQFAQGGKQQTELETLKIFKPALSFQHLLMRNYAIKDIPAMMDTQINSIGMPETKVYGRLPMEDFATLDSEEQAKYIKHMMSAPSAAFPRSWPETFYSDQGITLEHAQSVMQPYMDVYQTGMPQ